MLLRHDFAQLDHILAKLPNVNWHALSMNNFLHHIGKAVIVQLIETQWRFCLIQVDPGCPFYDPSSAFAMRRLMYLVELKGELMRSIVNRRPPSARSCSASSRSWTRSQANILR